jgi:hypothetical protein
MKRKFNYTESELYTLCLTGWDVCLKFLSLMTAFSPKYTLEFVQAKKDEVLMLMAQFNLRQRNSQISSLRRELNASTLKALKSWRSLKLYIEMGFPSDQTADKLDEAGFSLFKSAQKKQWEDLLKMMIAGKSFIAANKLILTQNQDMPEDFAELFDAVLEDFKSKFEAYIRAGINKVQDTEAHTTALNDIFMEVSKMFAVGKEVFKDDKVLRDQFQFSRNLRIMGGIGWAGIKGKITDENGKLKLIEGLEITLLETEDLVTQEEDGSYILNQLSSGVYTIKVEAPDYKTIETNVEVKVDTYTILDFNMEKLDALNEAI